MPKQSPVTDTEFRSAGPLGFSDQVIEDAVTLRDAGQLPPVLGALADSADVVPGTLAWQMLCDYLTATGRHGYAAQHLATYGVEHRCPPWCISPHDRFQLKLPGNCVFHVAWSWTDNDSAASVVLSAATREEDGRLSRPEIDIANCEALTGPQAQRLSTAIHEAVQRWQEISAA